MPLYFYSKQTKVSKAILSHIGGRSLEVGSVNSYNSAVAVTRPNGTAQRHSSPARELHSSVSRFLPIEISDLSSTRRRYNLVSTTTHLHTASKVALISLVTLTPRPLNISGLASELLDLPYRHNITLVIAKRVEWSSWISPNLAYERRVWTNNTLFSLRNTASCDTNLR